MAMIIKKNKINASKEEVWNIISDIGAIQNFNPNVSKSFYTSEIKEGIGASRHCDLLPMGKVEERVVSWKDGEEFTIEIYESKSMPFLGEGKFILKEEGGKTNVTMSLTYRMKGGFLGALMAVFMKGRISKAMEDTLAGLKHHIETGEIVTGDVVKSIKSKEPKLALN